MVTPGVRLNWGLVQIDFTKLSLYLRFEISKKMQLKIIEVRLVKYQINTSGQAPLRRLGIPGRMLRRAGQHLSRQPSP